MIYGPFSLVNYDDAEVLFSMMNDCETDYDSISWMASIDGANFNGYYTDGMTGGYPTTWDDVEFDLTAVPTLGNLCGHSQVWIAFVFESDLSVTYGGAYIDDVTIRGNVAGTGPGEIHGYKWDDVNSDDAPTEAADAQNTVEELRRQRDELANRLVELEEIRIRDDGSMYWRSCGEDV